MNVAKVASSFDRHVSGERPTRTREIDDSGRGNTDDIWDTLRLVVPNVLHDSAADRRKKIEVFGEGSHELRDPKMAADPRLDFFRKAVSYGARQLVPAACAEVPRIVQTGVRSAVPAAGEIASQAAVPAANRAGGLLGDIGRHAMPTATGAPFGGMEGYQDTGSWAGAGLGAAAFNPRVMQRVGGSNPIRSGLLGSMAGLASGGAQMASRFRPPGSAGRAAS